MKIKTGDKVRIDKVVKSKTNETYNKNKEKCLGKIGTVYDTHKVHNLDVYDSSLPNGVKVYSVKDDNGKDISPYVWFEEELVKIQEM